MSGINDDTGNDSDELAKALALFKNMSKNDMDLIAKLAAEQKKRKFLLIVKIMLIVIIIASSYFILRHDIYQRVFTPKKYWTNDVLSLEYSVKLMEEAIKKYRNDQTTWQRTYDDEFDKMVKGLQDTGMDRDNSIIKTKEILQSVAQGMQEVLDNERSMLTQFKQELELARRKLNKYKKIE